MSPVDVMIAIGWLPRLRVRSRLISGMASPTKNHHGYYSLLSAGSDWGMAPRLTDLESLSLEESLAFLRGINAVYSSHLRKSRDCVCNMPPAVTFPVFVYASMLRRDHQFARRHWDAFASIPRNCAERLVSGNYPDLRLLTFEQFVEGILGREYSSDRVFNEGKASAVSRKMLEAYDIPWRRYIQFA